MPDTDVFDEPCIIEDSKCIHYRKTDRISCEGVKFKTWDCYCEEDICASCIREMDPYIDGVTPEKSYTDWLGPISLKTFNFDDDNEEVTQ
jgi:hypothetical protein